MPSRIENTLELLVISASVYTQDGTLSIVVKAELRRISTAAGRRPWCRRRRAARFEVVNIVLGSRRLPLLTGDRTQPREPKDRREINCRSRSC